MRSLYAFLDGEIGSDVDASEVEQRVLVVVCVLCLCLFKFMVRQSTTHHDNDTCELTL